MATFGTSDFETKFKATVILSGPKSEEQELRNQLKEKIEKLCYFSGNINFSQLFGMLYHQISQAIVFKDTGDNSPDRVDILSLDVFYRNPNNGQWKWWASIRNGVNLVTSPGRHYDGD